MISQGVVIFVAIFLMVETSVLIFLLEVLIALGVTALVRDAIQLHVRKLINAQHGAAIVYTAWPELSPSFSEEDCHHSHKY